MRTVIAPQSVTKRLLRIFEDIVRRPVRMQGDDIHPEDRSRLVTAINSALQEEDFEEITCRVTWNAWLCGQGNLTVAFLDSEFLEVWIAQESQENLHHPLDN